MKRGEEKLDVTKKPAAGSMSKNLAENEKQPAVAVVRQKLTLDRPVTYEIKVPGQLDSGWVDWSGGLTISADPAGDGPTITTLRGELDQAALHGLLRRLYSFGLPLISVNRID